MRDALNATGYPIWFALWLAHLVRLDPRGGNSIGNSARVGPDTGEGESNSGFATAACKPYKPCDGVERTSLTPRLD